MVSDVNLQKCIPYLRIRGKGDKERIVSISDIEDGRSYSGKCYISHSNCLSDAEVTRDALEERFPNLRGNIRICDIGTIIASHCGPGTVAVFFLGDERTPDGQNV